MKILRNRVYRHFKGDYYIVLDFAINTQDGSKCVIYRALHGDGKLFVRDYEDFSSKIDPRKHPNALQEYRFELQEITTVNGDHK